MVFSVDKEGVEQIGAGGCGLELLHSRMEQIPQVHLFAQGQDHMVLKDVPIAEDLLLLVLLGDGAELGAEQGLLVIVAHLVQLVEMSGDVGGAVELFQDGRELAEPLLVLGDVLLIGVIEHQKTAVNPDDQIVMEVGTDTLQGEGDNIVGGLGADEVDADDVEVFVEFQVV